MDTKRVIGCGALLTVLSAVGAQDLEAELGGYEDEPAVEAGAWDLYGDLRLRYDRVDFNAPRDTISRGRSSLRAGIRFFPSDRFEIGGAIKAGLGTDDNDDNRANLDNERSDDIVLDELYVRWLTGDHIFTAGKTALAMRFTPATWDRDLRPVGVNWTYANDFAESRVQTSVGYQLTDHLYGEDSRFGSAQFGYFWHEDQPWGLEAILSYWHFSSLEDIPREGLARTNTVVTGQLAEDFRYADLQLASRHRLGGKILDARVDLIHNFGADDNNQGVRASLIYGDARIPGQLEFGYAIQRIQSDAVVAAVNEDDWWFPTRMRGTMPWIAYGISEGMWVQLSGFFERRDGASNDLDRILLDFQYNF